ncbi:MAG: Hpt domain-containing protein [Gemmatimonadota bacterium]
MIDPIDPEALNRLRRLGGEALLLKMRDLFLEHAPLRLEAIRQGRCASNLSAISRAAHSLKSSAGNLGAGALLDAAGRLESLADAGNRVAIPAACDEVEAAFRAAAARLASLEEETTT